MGNSLPNNNNFNNKFDNNKFSNLNNFNTMGPKPNIEKAKNLKKKNYINNNAHKLGQTPNNINTFIKKIEENKKKIEEEKQDNNKPIEIMKKNKSNKTHQQNKKLKNEFDKIVDSNNFIDKLIQTNKSYEKSDENINKELDELEEENILAKNYFNNYNNDNINNNNINNDCDENYENYEDDVRKPLPVINDKLVEDNFADEFIKFKIKIMSDKSIDKNMKQIIIQSRKEFIINEEKKIKERTEKTNRTLFVNPIIIRVSDKSYTKIIFEQKKILLDKINEWIDKKIELIELDAETLYQIFELIDIIIAENNCPNILEIKNIFVPTNSDEYFELVDLMQIIKAQSIHDESIRFEKEQEKLRKEEEIYLKKKEEEEKKAKQYIIREKKVYILNFNLNKVGGFDNKIKYLKEELKGPIEKYLNSETEFICLSEELYGDVIKFINSIRISKEDKENILGICAKI